MFILDCYFAVGGVLTRKHGGSSQPRLVLAQCSADKFIQETIAVRSRSAEDRLPLRTSWELGPIRSGRIRGRLPIGDAGQTSAVRVKPHQIRFYQGGHGFWIEDHKVRNEVASVEGIEMWAR
jgi:hypothetical protein